MEFYPCDPLESRRTKSMDVLILGLPQSGTTSICAALRMLNIRPYHFSEAYKNKDNHHFQLWYQAVEAKYDGKGKPWTGRQDFDRILWNYDAVTDDPCCLFVDELVQAYPEAKLILTTRSTSDAWFASMKKFILEILAWKKSYSILSLFDPDFTAPSMTLLNRTTRILSSGTDPTQDTACVATKQYYDDHARHVQDVADREMRPLLMFEPSMGWGPLCEFLNLPKPAGDVAYPHLNSTKDALSTEWALYWGRWRSVARRALVTYLPVVLVGVIASRLM